MASVAARVEDTAHDAGRSLMLAMLVIAAVINNADRGIFSLAMPAIKADYAFTDSELGLLGGLSFGIFYGLSALPIGYLALRMNRRNLLVICLALWSCATALTSVARGFAGLFAARSVVGMGEAGGLPLSLSLVAARYPPHARASANGWVTAGQAFGAIAGAWITGWLIAAAGWRSAFLVLGLPGLMLALLIRLTVAEPPPMRTEPARLSEVLQLWHAPAMRQITLTFALTGIVIYGTQAWLPSFYSRTFHLGPGTVGMLAGTIVGGSGLIGALASGYCVHHFGRGRPGFSMVLTGWISLITMPAGIVGALSHNLVLSCTMLATVGVANGARTTLLYTAAQEAAEDHTRPLAIAINASAVVLLGSGLGPPIFGTISDHAAGGIATAMAAFMVLSGLVAIPCWRFARISARERAAA